MGAIKKIVLAVILSAALTMMLLDHKSTQPLLAQTPSGGYGPGGGGGGSVTLDAILDPTADKTFAMGGNALKFNYTLQSGGGGSPAPFFVAGTDVNGAIAEINSLSTIAGGGPDGLQVWARANHTSGSVSEAAALFVNSLAGGNGGTTTQLVGIDLGLSSNTGAIVPTAYGIWLESPFYNGTTTESSGLFIDNQTGTPAAATSYGIQIADQTGGTSHKAIRTGLGPVELGDSLILDSTTVGALPAAAAGNKGWMRTVSDSTAVAAEGQTCVGGNTNTALAFSNGVQWKCF